MDAGSGGCVNSPRLASSERRSGSALDADNVRAWPHFAFDHADIAVGSERKVAMIRSGHFHHEIAALELQVTAIGRSMSSSMHKITLAGSLLLM